ncbi:DUF6712 family protein [Fibrivirga algicola]|uniref:Uncharacterized protein n=1 Tax=Fibrivirga algicola TaxID=2950420 RepID=A0ABX0QMQ8_9BACT|nr:DUF6712 family protein [Fibrivirga algicola]NID13780.1 hypothetical protein [Fibrivirga algicola]
MSQLIQTIDELKTAVNINRDTDITGLMPHLLSAEATLARQLGGFGVIDALLALTDPTPAQTRALAYMRRAVGNMALFKALPTQNVQITDAGVMRRTGGQQGDAFQWQYDEARSSLHTDGWDAVEDLLQVLETSPEDFPAWLETRPAPGLVPSAAVFNQFYFIDSRRLTYQALLPSMRKAETMQIRRFLTAQAIQVDELTGVQLELVQSALVSATLAIALRERQIDITEAGVQLLGTSEASTAATYRKPLEDSQRIESLIGYYQQQTRATLSDLTSALTPPPNVAETRSTGIGGDRIVAF